MLKSFTAYNIVILFYINLKISQVNFLQSPFLNWAMFWLANREEQVKSSFPLCTVCKCLNAVFKLGANKFLVQFHCKFWIYRSLGRTVWLNRDLWQNGTNTRQLYSVLFSRCFFMNQMFLIQFFSILCFQRSVRN